MRVFLTGATGFLGRALVLRLLAEGHRPVAWVRSPEAARHRLGPEVEVVPAAGGRPAMVAALEGCGAVVNLAGEPIFGRRWTAARRKALVESRVDLTRELVAALGEVRERPPALVSASAVGLYGDRGDELLDEASAPGEGFLAELCRRWEEAALEAGSLGVRVVLPRIGVVLGSDGGALASMLPVFRLGLGGRLGGGRQWVPWIHLDDLVEVLALAMSDPRLSGPVVAVAPGAVTNAALTRALADELGRPAFLPAPAFALRLLLGEVASVVLGGQRVAPRRLEELGHRFRHPRLEGALREILAHERTVEIGPATNPPSSRYLRERPASYCLRQEVRLPAPRSEVFEFFSRAENLGALTPGWLRWEILRAPTGPLSEGALLEYRIHLGPLPMRWRTRIERWSHGRGFVDAQDRGPYASWWHEHGFEARGQETVMRDEVHYALPLGPLGWLVHALVVGPTLRRIFGYRHEAVCRRFRAVEARAGRVEQAA